MDGIRLRTTAGGTGLVLGGTQARCAHLVPASSRSIGGVKSVIAGETKTSYGRDARVCLPTTTVAGGVEETFEKEVDLWFILHTGTFWPHDMFEPLLIGISFPLSRNHPWLVRQNRDPVVEVGRALSEMSKTCHLQVGDYLRELWLHPREFPRLPGRMVC